METKTTEQRILGAIAVREKRIEDIEIESEVKLQQNKEYKELLTEVQEMNQKLEEMYP